MNNHRLTQREADVATPGEYAVRKAMIGYHVSRLRNQHTELLTHYVRMQLRKK